MHISDGVKPTIKILIMMLGIIGLALMVFYFGYVLTPAGQAFMHSPERLYYFLSGGIADFVRTGLSALINPLWDLIVPAVNAVTGLTANIFSFIPHLAVAVPGMFVAVSAIQLISSLHAFYKAYQAEKESTGEEKVYWNSMKTDAAVGAGANLLVGVGILSFFLLGMAGPAFPIVLTVGFSALLLRTIYRARHPLTPPDIVVTIDGSAAGHSGIKKSLGISNVSLKSKNRENTADLVDKQNTDGVLHKESNNVSGSLSLGSESGADKSQSRQTPPLVV